LRSRYRIDDFQETYFVIESFDSLVATTLPDFAPIYDDVRQLDKIPAGALVPEDLPIVR
jgi:phenylalanine-4-hydroxylase